MTYTDWAERHALTFGFDTETDGERLRDWCDHFARWSFTPGELCAASEALARAGAPSWRPDHFGALRDAVLKAREPPREPPPEPGDPRGVCRDCGGTGRVIVPASGMRTAGGAVIQHGTMAALCRCPLGRWYGSRPPKSPGGDPLHMLTLDDYERARPGWRDEVQEEREAHRLAAESAASGPLAGSLGKLLALARKGLRPYREPGEEG